MLQYCNCKNIKGWAVIFSMFYGLLIMCCALTIYKLQINFMESSELYCANIIKSDYKEDEIQYLQTSFNNYFEYNKFSSLEELKDYLRQNAKNITFTRDSSRLYYNYLSDEVYIDIILKSRDTKRYVYKYGLKNQNVILLFYRNEYF